MSQMFVFLMIVIAISIWVLTMRQLIERTNGKNEDVDPSDDGHENTFFTK